MRRFLYLPLFLLPVLLISYKYLSCRPTAERDEILPASINQPQFLMTLDFENNIIYYFETSVRELWVVVVIQNLCF